LIQVAGQPKAWVCGHPLAEIVDLNPEGGVDVSLLSVMCVAR